MNVPKNAQLSVFLRGYYGKNSLQDRLITSVPIFDCQNFLFQIVSGDRISLIQVNQAQIKKRPLVRTPK